MATKGKCLIPVELLRRSCRGHKSSGQSRDVKREILCATTIKDEILVSPIDSETKSSGPLKVKLEPDDCDKKPNKFLDDNELAPDGYLTVDCDELDLEHSLMGGQSFRWTKSSINSKLPVFTGVVGCDALQLWRCDERRVAFKKLNKEGHLTSERVKATLEDYFQLKYKLKDLYKDWSRRDQHFANCSQSYKGFRILRQNPIENLFSFICATNNNIKRISLMIDKMCCNFGDKLESSEHTTQTYHTFPSVERLSQDDVFSSLRYDLGFGYRAKFICETAKKLISLAESYHMLPGEYLFSLRELSYKDTCKQLQAFPGIGRKVADCICLMSMDHLESVPIDCHIYDIVCRNYMPNLRHERKTLTESVHDLIGNYFNDLHGSLAGWATSVLFIAELKHLKKETDPSNGSNKTKKVDCPPGKRKRQKGSK